MSGKNRAGRQQNIRRGTGKGHITKVHKRRLLNHMKAEYFCAVIFAFVFIYLIINFLFYAGKEKTSIYEVQGDNISTESKFTGIALRNESIINSEYAGYINYYIQNGKRSARNGVIFSVDEGSKLYSEILEKTGIDQLQDNDIKSIKNVIYGYLDGYSGFNFNEVTEFKNEISDTIYELVNDSSIENMKLISSSSSSSAFHVKRADTAGVISYRTDKLCGLTVDGIKAEMYNENYDLGTENLRSTGLVLAGEPICRMVTDENWKIAVKVSEKKYISLLDEKKVSVYINDYYQPIECELETVQNGSDYYAILSLDRYMPMYIDERMLSVEFISNVEGGLKVPISAIAKKEFYVVPLDYFEDNDQYNGEVLLKEGYSEETGDLILIPVYTSKYFADNDYAYVDMGLFEKGDRIVNRKKDESYKIGATNTIEGVYIVSKGYYQFVKIERIRQNAEYAIVKKNTKDGLNLYDHIALDASTARDQEIIY
ncbi:MAG: hypothetical protein IKP88_02665 [Lachnospiraceae bacterium]|nr:hypothetical protein [Lachnospiraceae bacterium]